MNLRGLFIGRFQPFHIGHLRAVYWMLDRVDELIIAVGSAQYSHTIQNPFTAGERLEMIRASLIDDGIDLSRIITVTIPDIHVHSLWVKLVVSLSPRFHVVYSNEPLTRRLFEEEGFKVEGIPFFDREIYSATEVRRRILEDGDWRSLVPSVVARLIDEFKGVERIKNLARTDRVEEPKPGDILGI
ncbi:MAG: nicotinamide-nucleotide adenylyltransferase [Candidatus Bathyarchaeia archaeon]